MTLNSLTLNGKTYDKFPADRTRGLILPAEITGNAASTISVPMSLISIPLSGYKPSIGDMVLTLDNCFYKITGFAVGEETEYTGKLIRTLSSGSSENVDLTGYAKETWVQEGFQPKGDYLTEHQDISGKLDSAELPTAINTALAQAKASGEFKGDPGKDGVDGKDGADGKDGINGLDGINGKSAYELAVENGYKGTEAEWLASLTGAKGETGAAGKDGTDGADGDDGVSPTVAISKSGKVTTVSITDKNGTKTATINDGADGSPGSAGKDGTSVTVKSVSESTADGGSNVVTFSDGKTITIKNGSKGDSGVYVGSVEPVDPNVMVWVNPNGDADNTEIVNAVIAALPVYNGEVL